MRFAPIHLMRLMRVGFVLAREGAFALVDPREAPPGVGALVQLARLFEKRGASSSAEGLVAALTRLGPSYIKLGQFMATRPDVVGVRVARDLEKLQDRIPPFGRVAAVKEIEASFGKPIDSLYSEFSEPIAAASIAQVHRARTQSGETVAVKVYNQDVTIKMVDRVKICGKIFTLDPKVHNDENIKKPIEKLKNQLSQWDKRNLTADGRILIAKTFGISQIIYQMQNTFIESNILKEIETII